MKPVRVAHVATVDLTVRYLLMPQLHRLQEEGYDVTAISAPGPWAREIEEAGIRHVPWPSVTRSWDPAADARAFAEMVRILRRERFELVHTHTPKPGIMGRVAARAVGVPFVVNTVHGLYATPEDPAGKRAAVLAAEGLAARCSDLELFQSAEDLLWAGRRGLLRRGQGVLLGNGCDLGRFDPMAVSAERVSSLRKELDIPGGSVVVGTIGRLVAEKGYRELIEASRIVRAKRPDVRFLAVGDPQPAKADGLSADEITDAGEDVSFVGWRDDTPELLALMDVFVLPSWREGLPRSAVEAAAMGRPLVLTDIRGSREVVRDGAEGYLIPVRSPGRLAEAILRLAEDPELRLRMGKAARVRAEERFDERRVEDVLVRSYRRLLGPARFEDGARIRPARAADTPAVASLHRRSMPTAFLPTLGDGFLARLYRALAREPDGAVLVAEDRDGVLIGFAAGTTSVPRFYRRFLLRNGIGAALDAAPRLLDPAVRRRMMETARYPGSVADLPQAELLAIAVEDGHRGKGVGESLARDLLGRLSESGARRIRVVVDAANAGANGFYEKLGFLLAGEINVHAGAPSNVWVIQWPS